MTEMQTLPRAVGSGDELRALVARANRDLEGAHPTEVVSWAVGTFGDRFCVTSSFGDAVLATLVADAAPDVDVVFLDTGYHFPETLATRDRVAAELGVHVVTVRPELTVAEQNVAFGQSLYARDPDACCAVRKVEPLGRLLAGYDAWASGVRRDEGPSRAATPVVGLDRRGKVKISPLACWTQADVDAFGSDRGVIVNPLATRGFASVGCAPCTRAVRPGEDVRAGRWSGREKTECGLHG